MFSNRVLLLTYSLILSVPLEHCLGNLWRGESSREGAQRVHPVVPSNMVPWLLFTIHKPRTLSQAFGCSFL